MAVLCEAGMRVRAVAAFRGRELHGKVAAGAGRLGDAVRYPGAEAREGFGMLGGVV